MCPQSNKYINKNCFFFLEVFGIMRQAAGPNDHPTTPTFMHLYKILSVSSVLKPPKQGNCTVTDSDLPKISLSDIWAIFTNQNTISERVEKI